MLHKWLRMVPDDLELKHRHICALARIFPADVPIRIPPKR
jgi:hypothetical protein